MLGVRSGLEKEPSVNLCDVWTSCPDDFAAGGIIQIVVNVVIVGVVEVILRLGMRRKIS